MCHCPHSLDASSFQYPLHSLFPSFTTSESLAFLEDLGHIFLHFMFILFSWPHPFPFVFLSRLVLGPSPIGIVSACFWSYPSTRKQSTLQIIEGGDRRETNRGYVLFTLGFFSNPSHHLSYIVYMPFHFIGVLSRVFIERMRLSGDCCVVGG